VLPLPSDGEGWGEGDLPVKKTVYILIMTVVLAAVALAQEGVIERDPFSSREKALSAPAPVPADNSWGRDPFNNPLAGRAPARTERRSDASGKGLTGIIYSKNIRLAIINGEALREGSSVGDRRLASIGARSVKLKNAGGGIEEVFLQDFSMRK
jgi:hypothetical protein